jgi:hypothetical protein
MAIGGAVTLAVWATPRFGLHAVAIEKAANPSRDPDVTGSISSHVKTWPADAALASAMALPGGPAATAAPASTAAVSTGAAAAELRVDEANLPDSRPPRHTENPVRLAVALPADGVKESPLLAEPPFAAPIECAASPACIDDYLWSLYERTPKVDTNRETERVKRTVKRKGKLRTILATITKYVLGDFTWKDPAAAEKASMPLKDYVIGGMDPGFKRKLYHGLRAIEDAGFMPGITSAFRDDYRQGIAAGNKAASDSSYHGGSRRGGYGHGLAADIVSVKGATRLERVAASEEMWKWIDAHDHEIGIGRPYRDRDPPHVGAIDGREYVQKRAVSKQREAFHKRAPAVRTQARKHSAAAGVTTAVAAPAVAKPAVARQAVARQAVAKPATPEKPSKVSSLDPAGRRD